MPAVLNYAKWDALDSDEDDETPKAPPAPGEAAPFTTTANWTNDEATATLTLRLPETVSERGTSVIFEEESTVVRLMGAYRGKQGNVPQDMKIPHLPVVPRECSWTFKRDPSEKDASKRVILSIHLIKVEAKLWPSASFSGEQVKPKVDAPPAAAAEAAAAPPPPAPHEAAQPAPADDSDPSRWTQEGTLISLYFGVPTFPGRPAAGTKDIKVTCDSRRRLAIRVAGVGVVAAVMARSIVPDETAWFFDVDEEARRRKEAHAKGRDTTDRIIRVELTSAEEVLWEVPFDAEAGGGFTPTPEYVEAKRQADEEEQAMSVTGAVTPSGRLAAAPAGARPKEKTDATANDNLEDIDEISTEDMKPLNTK